LVVVVVGAVVVVVRDGGVVSTVVPVGFVVELVAGPVVVVVARLVDVVDELDEVVVVEPVPSG
jgi:hypothetical protein